MMKINAYCMDWHLGKSGAFGDLVVDALKGRVNISLINITNWKASTEPQIFCQIALPAEVLSNPKAKVVWIPMWDNVWDYPQSWWNQLPKHIKVVCFSKTLYEKVSKAGLQAVELSYFKNAPVPKPTNWDSTTLFYWNRTGLFSRSFLTKLCNTLNAERLIFRPDIDPGISKSCYYELPAKIGSTRVEIIHEMDRQSAYEKMCEANIYLAPRKLEGVGMTFIEALSRGMAVIAYDAPTMNEYIEHGKNGYLVSADAKHPVRVLRGLQKVQKKLLNVSSSHLVSSKQDWESIGKTNWKQLGNNAATTGKQQYERWVAQLDEYFDFITSWD